MKTIKQIADEIGVSKQAVHQKRKSKELSTTLQPFTSTVDGVVYISVDGESVIKSAFYKNVPSTTTINVDGNQNELYKILKSELEAKNKLIDEQQQIIGILTATLENTTASLTAAQALHAGTIQDKLTDGRAESAKQDAPTIERATKKWWPFGKK